MYHSGYHELIRHTTADFPLAFYHVDAAFPRYRMPMHWHDEVELIRILRGKLRLYLDSSEYLLSEGDFCSIGGGVIHGGEPEDCVYQCVVFNLYALTPSVGACDSASKSVIHGCTILKNGEIATREGLRESIDRLFGCAKEFRGEALRMLSRLYDTLAYLSDPETLHIVTRGADPGIRRSEQLKPALEYIVRNYSQRITLEQLASLSGFSPKYFCRYFRAYAHRSPIDYINYYRIERAAEFLSDGNENVAEVAVKCGFTDSSAFIKQFKRYKGITPKQYQLRALEVRDT